MTLLVLKNIEINYFCFLHYLLSPDSKAIALLKVPSLLTSFFKTFHKKKLNQSHTVLCKGLCFQKQPPGGVL